MTLPTLESRSSAAPSLRCCARTRERSNTKTTSGTAGQSLPRLPYLLHHIIAQHLNRGRAKARNTSLAQNAPACGAPSYGVASELLTLIPDAGNPGPTEKQECWVLRCTKYMPPLCTKRMEPNDERSMERKHTQDSMQ